jgi:hypothetical protein
LWYNAFEQPKASIRNFEKSENSTQIPTHRENRYGKSINVSNGVVGRYAYWVDGNQKDIKRTEDENRNPFKAERAAIKAREYAIIRAQSKLSHPQKSPKKRAALAEVFVEYCEIGRCGKAYDTIRKQESL